MIKYIQCVYKFNIIKNINKVHFLNCKAFLIIFKLKNIYYK